MDVSFMEKPALAMELEDFVKGLNVIRQKNEKINFLLSQKGVKGDITPQIARKFKARTFNSSGTLTVEGLMDIYDDLKKAGLSKHSTIRGYMNNLEKVIDVSVVA